MTPPDPLAQGQFPPGQFPPGYGAPSGTPPYAPGQVPQFASPPGYPPQPGFSPGPGYPAQQQPAAPQQAGQPQMPFLAPRPVPLKQPAGVNAPATAAGVPQLGGPARPIPIAARPVPIKKEKADPTKPRVTERAAEQEMLESPQDVLVQNTPPFLISVLIHVAIVLVLAFMAIDIKFPHDATLEVTLEPEETYAEEIGEQLNQETTMIAAEPDPTVTKAEFSPSDLPPVPDPFASPSPADLMPDGATAAAFTTAPVNGIAEGRTAGKKESLLGRFGGTKTTEESVRLALKWLIAQQRPDGSWSLQGPYRDGGGYENPVSATAMALLALQGYGTTDKTGEFKAAVEKGWKPMLRFQDQDGLFTSPAIGNHNNTFYTHGQALIAVCEIYAMTQDERFREPAQRAINYVVKYQDQRGGWRYLPGSDSDTSVTGWILVGLMSGKMAGLDVPEATLQKVTAYLDAAQMDGGSTYSYRPGYNQVTAAMSAEGLLMRQFLGWSRDDERLTNGVRKVISFPVERDKVNFYYWYYATQVCHHMEGDYWKEWNVHMRQIVPELQTKKGPEAGSWDPSLDAEWGHVGGRLYSTCFCVYMLEVYYRHMPLYDKLYKPQAGMQK